MECAPTRAEVWLDRHESDLGPLRIGDAVALVEAAGLAARVVPYAAAGTADEQRADRVNLRLTEAGDLGSVDAG